MAFKIPVEDRVSTYPGRVILKPVSGAENTFDMQRADLPLSEGTPINKRLFDSKSDCLTEDVTVYVSSTGDDVNGTGYVDSPFATIQKAINALPKNLNGHIAVIDISGGTYEETISCKGFNGGTLVVGIVGRGVEVRAVEVDACSFVEINVHKITYANGFPTVLYKVTNGSNVHVGQSVTMDGKSTAAAGMSAVYNSTISAINGVTVTLNNFGGSALMSTNGSIIALYNVAGSNSLFGLNASVGGLVAYEKSTLTSGLGDDAWGGGRIQTGGGVSALSNATVE